MRILSQDGKIDMPYENFSLSITQDNCIVAARDVVARPTEMLIGVVAKYSTEAKARKSMEMLRNAYSPKIEIKEPVAEEIPKPKCNDWVWTVKEPRIEVLDNFYFQFPSDDEVEVWQ